MRETRNKISEEWALDFKLLAIEPESGREMGSRYLKNTR